MKYIEIPLQDMVVKIKVRYSEQPEESKDATFHFLNTIALYMDYGYDRLKCLDCPNMATECKQIETEIFEYLKKNGCYK